MTARRRKPTDWLCVVIDVNTGHPIPISEHTGQVSAERAAGRLNSMPNPGRVYYMFHFRAMHRSEYLEILYPHALLPDTSGAYDESTHEQQPRERPTDG